MTPPQTQSYEHFFFHTKRQRAGGSADDSDIKPKAGGFSFFGGKKKKEPEPEPEPEKKNWWTL